MTNAASGDRPRFLSPTPLPALESPEAPALRRQIAEACHAWLMRSPSRDTRTNYTRDLGQFLAFTGVPPDRPEALATIRPHQVAAWRDHLRDAALTNASIVRKMTVLRSLFSYLQTYGYVGANPAHSDFVAAPSVSRDGKTVGLSPEACRRLLDAPQTTVRKRGCTEGMPAPAAVRDRALFSVLAYTGCRVGELA